MKTFPDVAHPNLAELLLSGGVAVIPTDTLYGIVARAGDKSAVDKVFRLRGRNLSKPCIVLAANIEQLAQYADWTPAHKQLAQRYWPGPLSLVIPATPQTPDYLQHSQTHTVAFRVPGNKKLQELLKATGLLIAPSANPAGKAPATTLAEAQRYFGDSVDAYIDGGDLSDNAPSTLVTVKNGKPHILRQGGILLDTPGGSERV